MLKLIGSAFLSLFCKNQREDDLLKALEASTKALIGYTSLYGVGDQDEQAFMLYKSLCKNHKILEISESVGIDIEPVLPSVTEQVQSSVLISSRLAYLGNNLEGDREAALAFGDGHWPTLHNFYLYPSCREATPFGADMPVPCASIIELSYRGDRIVRKMIFPFIFRERAVSVFEAVTILEGEFRVVQKNGIKSVFDYKTNVEIKLNKGWYFV